MSNELSTQREVTLFYTQSNERKTLLSSAKTWGDLSNEIGESFAQSKVVLQESRLTLENTEAMLPNDSFTLFVFPRQSKAGVTNKDRNWSLMNYNKLRSLASKLNKTKKANIPMNSSKEAIASGVSKFYGGTGKFAAPAPKKAAPVKKTKGEISQGGSLKHVKPSKVVKKKVAKVVKSVGDDLNQKLAKAKPVAKKVTVKKSAGDKLNEKLAKVSLPSSDLTAKQYDNIVSKLDKIIDIIDAATPTMDSKELNKLKDLASSVRGGMVSMQ